MMSHPILMFDPKAAADVEAGLDFGADALTVFDRNGRKLQHWPYAEIVHACGAGRQRDEVLAHAGRPELHLQIRDDAVYRAIQARAPQLRQLRRGWRTFWKIMEGMPPEAWTGILLLAAVAVAAAASIIAKLFR